MMNRGGGSPSAAANYLLCTNCRKVLRKVRARRPGGERRFALARSRRTAGRALGELEGSQDGAGAWARGGSVAAAGLHRARADARLEKVGWGACGSVFQLVSTLLPSRSAPLKGETGWIFLPVQFSCRWRPV